MNKPVTLLLAATLAAGSLAAADKKQEAAPSNVTVTFTDSDKFSDAQSTFGMGTDKYYLDLISSHLQQAAGRLLGAGQKLEITVKDVDLAGEFLPTRSGMEQVRIIKEVFIPRITLSFKLTDAEGKVLKEGDRKLQDLNFMNNIGITGRNEPLFYDKAMLSDWVAKEFKS